MRDRIVFFVLGAIIATVAYFVGDMSNISAQNGRAVFDKLVVRDTLTVGKRVLVGNELSVGGYIQVHHKLPDNKMNVITIAADKDRTRIRQTLKMEREGEKAHLYKNSSTWAVNDEVTQLSLYGLDNNGSIITLGSQNAVKGIDADSQNDSILSIEEYRESLPESIEIR